MTTWLPAICAAIVVLCTIVVMLDPAFNSNSPHVHANDRVIGAALGFLAGLGIAGGFYVLVRLAAWGFALAGG